MSNSINKVFLMGRLGHDPKVASTPTGRTVTELNIATSETYGKGEDKKEKTEWHKVICWDKLGEVAGNYLKKGSQVHVEGKITYRDYMDRDNKKRYVTEIVANNLIFIGLFRFYVYGFNQMIVFFNKLVYLVIIFPV